jgi:hypothetical protein
MIAIIAYIIHTFQPKSLYCFFVFSAADAKKGVKRTSSYQCRNKKDRREYPYNNIPIAGDRFIHSNIDQHESDNEPDDPVRIACVLFHFSVF